MDANDQRRDELIWAIIEIIERNGTPRSKAKEIVDGILLPAVDDIALSFRILERVHDLKPM